MTKTVSGRGKKLLQDTIAILALTWPRHPSKGTPVDDATDTGVPVGVAMVVGLPRVFGA